MWAHGNCDVNNDNTKQPKRAIMNFIFIVYTLYCSLFSMEVILSIVPVYTHRHTWTVSSVSFELCHFRTHKIKWENYYERKTLIFNKGILI